MNLEGEQDHETHGEAEKSHSLGQSESKNGIGEELLLQRWVTGVSDDKSSEDVSDTSSRSSDTNGGSSSSDVLGSGVDILTGDGGVQAASSQRTLRAESQGNPLGLKIIMFYTSENPEKFDRPVLFFRHSSRNLLLHKYDTR